MRLDRGPGGLAIAEPDRSNEAAKPDIDENLLRCRRQCTDRRLARAEPAADETRHQRAAAAAERERNRPELDADEASQQAEGDAGGKEGDVGAIAGAQHLANP